MSTVKRFAVISGQLKEHPQGCFVLFQQVQKDHARALRAETALVNLLGVIDGNPVDGYSMLRASSQVEDAVYVMGKTHE